MNVNEFVFNMLCRYVLTHVLLKSLLKCRVFVSERKEEGRRQKNNNKEIRREEGKKSERIIRKENKNKLKT